MESTDRTFADILIAGLKNAATELEELQVQLALGKAEARDVFEDLKRKFNEQISDLKAKYNNLLTNKNVAPVVQAFDNLQMQLAPGVAETKELFQRQLENIGEGLSLLELELEKSGSLNTQIAETQLEIEKFKAKLKLIALRFELKKIVAEYNFQQRKTEFQNKMEELKIKLDEKEQLAKDKWNFFKNEIEEAYSHLKKVFS